MRLTITVALAMLAVSFGAVAADGGLSVTTVAQKEVAAVDDNGQPTTRLEPVTTVVPGDEVIYTITYSNRGQQPADRVVITDPVPAEMRYVQGSAFGPGTQIAFSADGGQTWGTADTLFVIEPDGTSRPAVADDYTHIRWTMRSSLKPGGRGYARFRAELR